MWAMIDSCLQNHRRLDERQRDLDAAACNVCTPSRFKCRICSGCRTLCGSTSADREAQGSDKRLSLFFRLLLLLLLLFATPSQV